MIQAEVNQTLLRGGQRIPRVFLLRVLRETSRVLRLKSGRRVSIAFVSPRLIRELNRSYRGQDRQTDVLSFNLSGPTDGEILICFAQAKRQAAEHGRGVRDEITLLVVHGLLHVFGHDHATRREEKAMFTLQNRILKRLGIASYD